MAFLFWGKGYLFWNILINRHSMPSLLNYFGKESFNYTVPSKLKSGLYNHYAVF